MNVEIKGGLDILMSQDFLYLLSGYTVLMHQTPTRVAEIVDTYMPVDPRFSNMPL